MAIEYKRYVESQTNYQMQNFNNLDFNTLTDLFGNCMTWNQLNKYNDRNEISLQVATKVYDDKCILTVWFDEEYIKDIEFMDVGSELIYRLDQLETDD